ncbi:MAG: hypothetical protein QNK03_25080, partial [Myxococcota bacterium]|nr:hypothetical protein [Myxococcota bacterium]
MRNVRWGLRLLCAALLAGPAAAQPLAREQVPGPLAPWVDWVLRGHEDERCPFLHGPAEQRACTWPTVLELELGDTEGRFEQSWLVAHEADVPLPGDARRWPQDVRADGEPVPVVAVRDRPSVRLSSGRHVVSGSFRWDALPELIQIPAETGIVRLHLRGRGVPFPERDAQGRLWLQKRARPDAEGSEQRLDVKAHRRVVDDVPLRLETRLELWVSGRSREVLLGRALPDGFVPLSLASPLPARVDRDGRLRVQVRPGRWRIALAARHTEKTDSIAMPEPGGPWDDSEVWVFEAQPHLRLVVVEDGVPVDPAQTTLPEEWKHLPAYVMEPGRALRLVEKRRGESDPAPDQLTLARSVWLDFDGGGYTLSDRIEGEVRRSTRLEMGLGTELGRVAIGGRDQLITRLGDSPRAGVEVPQGRIQLVADSRLEGNGVGPLSAVLPAVGWDHDFQALEATLHLPPGWRLFHASGVDRAATTWIERWTLLDLFAVLVLAAAVFQLWGARWGTLALVALALTWTEPGAPHWAWAAVLAGEALRRVLPDGRFPRFVRVVSLYRAAALGLLVLIALPFAVEQVRAGLFPALERPGPPMPVPLPASAQLDQLESRAYVEEAAEPPAKQVSGVFRGYAPDPQARITTGPGLPAWQWSSVALQWSGPVRRDQALRLLLIPPLGSGVLAFLRVALMAALLLCLLGATAGGARGLPRRGAATALVAAALALLPSETARADIPPQSLLDELRERLLANPACHPSCASSPRLALDVRPAALRARVEVHAQAETGVPLPGGARSWSPERVLVDGEPASGLLRGEDGTLWVRLAAGRHQVVVEGALPERDSVELSLPLSPRRVEVRTDGWTVHGVHEDGLAETNLQLTRIREAGEEPERTLESGELPPFVRVERTLRLGLDWQVSTQVIRLSPADTALLLELPLLTGESITSAGIRSEDGRALVTMGPGVSRTSWTSILDQRPRIVLRAPEDSSSTELWRLDVGPVWHVDLEGIPSVHQASSQGARIRAWRPWP